MKKEIYTKKFIFGKNLRHSEPWTSGLDSIKTSVDREKQQLQATAS